MVVVTSQDQAMPDHIVKVNAETEPSRMIEELQTGIPVEIVPERASSDEQTGQNHPGECFASVAVS